MFKKQFLGVRDQVSVNAWKKNISLKPDSCNLKADSGKGGPSFLRSDSDSNTYHAFSTPSTLCSESERKDDGHLSPQSRSGRRELKKDFSDEKWGCEKEFILSLRSPRLCGEKEFGVIYEL